MPQGSREILIECSRIGNVLRVAAIDTLTGTEVVFQAPLNTPPPSLHRLAADKMRYVLEKQKKQ